MAEDHLDPRIVAAIAAEQSARACYDAVVSLVQTECQHPHVGETPHERPTFASEAKPPFRVCLCCGLREEGWGSGYKILTMKRVYGITRDEGYAATHRSA